MNKPETRSTRRRNDRELNDLDPAMSLLSVVNVPKKKEPAPDTGMGLARYFSKVVGAAIRSPLPDITNHKKLAKEFNKWVAGGIPHAQIRTVIDFYAAHEDLRDRYVIPWIDFVNNGPRIAVEQGLFD